ncbi:Dihydrolipoyl dehydrogenase [Candidatus Kinetoplastibacterium sorsogonicusi]|uniref:Dihydrolipoyl dehydrogenase n=1 Tax=Candidatus Kinetoplastidibacterium kentomonadis TaxID=1576550 RepID=A0A3Q8ERE8_9PROT|nr:dihydrolipoyl dehydrogenase [Candidatus Kinetoplastibacterium sorsogonicusi]AWD32537.1 Dihydrolipoyl dehydrogenase [Candidatus Kinetoplastibacterium sorsogonicusi]
MNNKFDLIVIGAGPGGYIAAIRASQLGMSVACIDAWSNINGNPAPGGTCTNVGCIPSKALLQSSEYFDHVNHSFHTHGIEISNAKININNFLKRKDNIVKQNNEGILYLFKKNKVSFFHGKGSFFGKENDQWLIKVKNKEESILSAKNVIIATGSIAREFPNIAFDEQTILSNDGALSINTVPKKLGIIGAGVIGLELGSVWRRLGADVTILESAPNFLAAADSQISKEAFKLFTKQGLKINVGIEVKDISYSKNSVSVKYKDSSSNNHEIIFDKLIVSIGRIPFTKDLNAESVGLTLDSKGFISVDNYCKTNLQNIWAIGDVVRGPMLAHKAEEEGVFVAEMIAGQKGHLNFNNIPWVIYTSPEIAWVGKNEQQLKELKRDYKIGSFPFIANGRARALGDTSGFVKIIADKYTDEVLGVHIIGAMASELISEAVTIMEFKGSSEDIARIWHAHPTLSESLKEAALALDNRSLNY